MLETIAKCSTLPNLPTLLTCQQKGNMVKVLMPESNWQKQPTNIVYVCPCNYQFSFVRIHFLQFPTYFFVWSCGNKKVAPCGTAKKNHKRVLTTSAVFSPSHASPYQKHRNGKHLNLWVHTMHTYAYNIIQPKLSLCRRKVNPSRAKAWNVGTL